MTEEIEHKGDEINKKEETDSGEEEKKIEKNEIIYKKMTKEEINVLAEDVYRGAVFIDKFMRSGTDIRMVFMPIAFMSQEQLDIFKKNPPGMIYEYLSKALNMSVDGMPIFMSFICVSQEDTKKVLERYNKIVETLKQMD